VGVYGTIPPAQGIHGDTGSSPSADIRCFAIMIRKETGAAVPEAFS